MRSLPWKQTSGFLLIPSPPPTQTANRILPCNCPTPLSFYYHFCLAEIPHEPLGSWNDSLFPCSLLQWHDSRVWGWELPERETVPLPSLSSLLGKESHPRLLFRRFEDPPWSLSMGFHLGAGKTRVSHLKKSFFSQGVKLLEIQSQTMANVHSVCQRGGRF